MTRSPSAAVPTSRRRVLAWSGASVTAAAFAAAGCSAPDDGAGSAQAAPAGGTSGTLTRIGLDYPFTQLPLYSTPVKLSTAAAKKHGISMLTTSDAGNADTQATNLNAWVAQKVPAIVSFPIVFEATESSAAAALGAGLIWVTYGASLEHQSADIRFSFVEGGTLLGEAAAKWAGERLGGKGKVAFLTDHTIQLGRERSKGMIDAFTRHAPGVDVVAEEQAIDPDTGLSKSRAVLAKHPDVNIILGVTDAAAYGGFKALQQTGRAKDDALTFVGGQDGSAPSLLAIKQGTFYRASAALAPEDIAAAIVDVVLVISGHLDLSVGSTLALGGQVAGWLAGSQEQSPVVAVLGALAAGAVVGTVNGILCCYLGLSAFIVTLGMLTAVRGLAQQLFPLPLSGFGSGFAWLGGSRIAGVDAPVLIAVLVLVAGAVFLALTPAGRHVFAIGVNREAAHLSGIDVRRTPFALFVVTGVAAALAGAVKASVLASAVAGTSGAGFELTVLTAVLLGGVALTGGSGSVFGVLLGVLFLGCLQNGLTLLSVPTFWQQMAQGTALVAGAAPRTSAPGPLADRHVPPV